MLKNALVFPGVFFCSIPAKQFQLILLNVLSNKI
jgi:hypothetical protein